LTVRKSLGFEELRNVLGLTSRLGKKVSIAFCPVLKASMVVSIYDSASGAFSLKIAGFAAVFHRLSKAKTTARCQLCQVAADHCGWVQHEFSSQK
jgi:hypothetical protein